jgi:opacity protein-like surface antigen
MKKFLVGAVATAALLVPAVAQADTNAVVGLQYSSTDIDSFDLDAYGIEGAFSHDFSNGTVFQFDGASDRVDVGGCCYSSSYGAAHYGLRNDNYAIGGFASFDELFIYSGLGLGVEGQLYLNNIVLNGSIAHADFGDLDVDTTTAAVDATYFFSPNLGLTGLVSVSDDEIYGDDTTTYGISGEYRLASSPLSFELGVRQTDIFDDDATTWTLGVNFDFGTGSLHERATDGPSFNGAANLHDYLSLLPTP